MVDIYGNFHDLLGILSFFSDTSGGGAESGSTPSYPRLYKFCLVDAGEVCVCVCARARWHLLFLFI